VVLLYMAIMQNAETTILLGASRGLTVENIPA
jgi:hypothetical protein